jgi:hypothetical protein
MNNEIKKSINTSRYRGWTANEEKQTLGYLRSIPEAEALEILKYMVDQKSLISPLVGKRILRTKDYVKSFFEYGILRSNAQTIKEWLEFAIPKIGCKAVIYLIKEWNTESNQLMEKAIYWLPAFISKDDIKSQALLNQLKEKREKVENNESSIDPP